MKTALVAILLVGYILILVAVLAYLVRRSYTSENGWLRNWFQKPQDTPQRTRLLRRSARRVKMKHDPEILPYSYEVVKAQLPYADEDHFFTEISRSHLHQQTPSLWSPPLYERRNLPKLFVQCYSDDEGEEHYQHKKTTGGEEHYQRRKTAADELKENSKNDFKKESLYKTYSDLENNELRCFGDSKSDSCMSLIDENFESISPRSTPSSSRSSSEKRRSPLLFGEKKHSPFEKKHSPFGKRHSPFEKKDENSSNFKNKLKKKLAKTKSNEHF